MHRGLKQEIHLPIWLTRFFTLLNPIAERLATFFRFPFSIYPSMILALGLGGISSLISPFLDRRWAFLATPPTPWRSLSVMAALLVVVYWASNRSLYCWKASRLICAIATVVVCGVCVAAAYDCCSYEHLCMGGHMQHPPYGTAAYINDLAWIGGLLLPVYTLARLRSPLMVFFAYFAGFLVSFRLIFGSFGGAYYPF